MVRALAACAITLASLFGTFEAEAATPAGTVIVNQASMNFDVVPGASAAMDSNTVDTTVQQAVIQPAKIAFFTDNTFGREARVWSTGNPLFVNIQALACNDAYDHSDRLSVTFQSKNTGDSETLVAEETS